MLIDKVRQKLATKIEEQLQLARAQKNGTLFAPKRLKTVTNESGERVVVETTKGAFTGTGVKTVVLFFEKGKLWANPITRSELLKKLEQQGCGKSDLIKLQEMIDADNCDLFDVLEYISYARKPITRAERVANAQSNIYTFLNEKQRDFIDFVLKNYLQDGVDELDIKNLSSILASKYGSPYDGQKALGSIAEIQSVFIDFQQHLYNEKVA